MNIAEYIEVSVLVVGGVLVLCFPQKLTKKDLSLPENQKARSLLKIAGVMALVAAVCLFLSQTLRQVSESAH